MNFIQRAPADLLAAIQFLTRLPVPSPAYRRDALSRSLPYFAFVGLMLGAVAAAVDLLLRPHLPLPLPAVFTVAFLVLITGCLHEDGLADAADAFGGGWNREQILSILKDSRIGSYGAAALALSLLARVALLAVMPTERITGCLIAAHVLCRWTTLPLSFFLSSARTAEDLAGQGQGARLARLTTRGTLIFSTIVSFALAILALRLRAVAAIAGAVLLTFSTGVYYKRRIGGVTGDCFGATNQITEICVYVCGAWVA